MYEELLSKEKKAIETTYFDVMDIFELKDITVRNRTRQELTKVYENIPCALSKRNPTNVYMNNEYGNMDYTYELFTSPNIIIKAGSIVKVTQQGKVYELENLGEPMLYPTHQEIICQRKDKA